MRIGLDLPLLLRQRSVQRSICARLLSARALLAAGADVHARGDVGNTPLHMACERGDARCVDVLLALGATQTEAALDTLLRYRRINGPGEAVDAALRAHGQLYVAFSGCGDPVNLCVFGPPPEADGAVWIKNDVYKEVLIEDT